MVVAGTQLEPAPVRLEGWQRVAAAVGDLDGPADGTERCQPVRDRRVAGRRILLADPEDRAVDIAKRPDAIVLTASQVGAEAVVIADQRAWILVISEREASENRIDCDLA